MLKGSVATVADLDNIVDPEPGDLYVVIANGNGYVWNGTAWDNTGPIQGPQGDVGFTGSQGIQGNPGTTDYNNLTNKPTIDTTSGTTASIANNATGTLNLTGGRAYVLYKIQSSAAAWVRIYTDAAARTADANREQGQDPGITSGVIAEAITTDAETVVYAPAVNGFNDENPSTDVMPIAVTNLSGSNAAITVTVTKLTIVA